MADISKSSDNSTHTFGGFMGGSIQQHKKTKKFYIKLFLEGKQVCISTDKTTNTSFRNITHARKVLGIIQREIDIGTFNRDEWRRNKDVERFVTLAEYKDKWLQRRSQMCEVGKLVPRTLKDDKTCLNRYLVPAFGHTALRSITAESIDDFHSNLPMSKASKYNITATLRKILHDAMSDKLISIVPHFPRMSKKTYAKKKFMSPADQDKVISKIPPRHQPIFQVMRQYGLRPSEVRALMKNSIREGEIHIEWSFSENLLRNTTKTGESRSYLITGYVQKILDKLPKNNSRFLLVRDDGEPYSSKNLNRIWSKALQDADMPHFKMYNAMRHSLARNLLEQGYGFDVVAEVLGHASVEMTRSFYADMPMSKIRDALTSLSESQKWDGR